MHILSSAEIRPEIRLANYFGVKKGMSWGQRAISDFELICIIKGRFLYETGTTATELSAKDVLCIPPDQPHTLYRLDRPAKAVFSCIHFEPLTGSSYAAGDYELEPFPDLVTRPDKPELIEQLFRRCASEFSNYGKYSREISSTIVKEIWLRLAAGWSNSVTPASSGRIGEMIQYLRANLFAGVGRNELAQVFCITPEHVNALFKKELGISPTGFVHQERVNLAYRLMKTRGLSVKQAAAQVGFADQFYFSRVFKKVMGTAPSRI